jgi:hypothetical protein
MAFDLVVPRVKSVWYLGLAAKESFAEHGN